MEKNLLTIIIVIFVTSSFAQIGFTPSEAEKKLIQQKAASGANGFLLFNYKSLHHNLDEKIEKITIVDKNTTPEDKITCVSPGKYMIDFKKNGNNEGKSFIYDSKTGLITKIPQIGKYTGNEFYLTDGTTIGKGTKGKKAITVHAEKEGKRHVIKDFNGVTLDNDAFEILPDGSYFIIEQSADHEKKYYKKPADFVCGPDAPLSGLFENKKNTLKYSSSMKGELSSIITEAAFEHPGFVDSGKHVVFWKLDAINTDTKTKTLSLIAININTRKKKVLETLELPYLRKNGNGDTRIDMSAPWLTHFKNLPFVAYRKHHADAAWYYNNKMMYYYNWLASFTEKFISKEKLIVCNISTGRKQEITTKDGWRYILPIDNTGKSKDVTANFSNHICMGRFKEEDNSVELKVLKLPNLKKVYNGFFRSLDNSYHGKFSANDWVSETLRADYITKNTQNNKD